MIRSEGILLINKATREDLDAHGNLRADTPVGQYVAQIRQLAFQQTNQTVQAILSKYATYIEAYAMIRAMYPKAEGDGKLRILMKQYAESVF